MAEVKLDLHRAVFDGERQLSGVAYELRVLARSLARAGNKDLALELIDYSHAIEKVGDDVVKAYGRDLDRRVGESSERLNELFKLAEKMGGAVQR